ncbi:MAG: DUF488 domain-containing protein [Bacteroidales bacterium]|nr:DUF488 domain-containing protein [Bacteroidales bacterium]
MIDSLRVMFYRRKLILALIKELGGELTSTQLQKYLFLMTRQQESRSFDFVPYYYGCFSFQANQDAMTMLKQGLISEKNSHLILEDTTDYFSELNIFDQAIVRDIATRFGDLSADDLIHYTYVNYPFYAIKSTIAKELLSSDEYMRVENQKRHFDSNKLFTIGYEGKSLERYLDFLIINDVRALCDVRKNAYSQKYGFTGNQLDKACKGVGIKYIHIPELGVESCLRQNLVSQSDYDSLFDYYEENTLPANWDSLLKVRDIISQEGRVALTCFEQDPKQCHRSRVAKALMNLDSVNYEFDNIL